MEINHVGLISLYHSSIAGLLVCCWRCWHLDQVIRGDILNPTMMSARYYWNNPHCSVGGFLKQSLYSWKCCSFRNLSYIRKYWDIFPGARGLVMKITNPSSLPSVIAPWKMIWIIGCLSYYTRRECNRLWVLLKRSDCPEFALQISNLDRKYFITSQPLPLSEKYSVCHQWLTDSLVHSTRCGDHYGAPHYRFFPCMNPPIIGPFCAWTHP